MNHALILYTQKLVPRPSHYYHTISFLCFQFAGDLCPNPPDLPVKGSDRHPPSHLSPLGLALTSPSLRGVPLCITKMLYRNQRTSAVGRMCQLKGRVLRKAFMCLHVPEPDQRGWGHVAQRALARGKFVGNIRVRDRHS